MASLLLYLPWSFGLFAMRLGAGRTVKSDPLDYETGIVFDKKVGERVKKGERIARIS